MKIKSSAFKNQKNIPTKFTCQGQDISPELSFENVPENTKYFALVVDDPDAPGQTFVHWLLWNIPANKKELEQDFKPESALQGKNDFGKLEYGGPCPPSGTHRYRFKLYALDSKLDLDKGASKIDLEKAMKGKVLKQAQLIGLYQKK